MSWRISSLTLTYWDSNGQIVQKAHHCKEAGNRYGVWHAALCGTAIRHLEAACVEAPALWPACRKCAKKPFAPVPEAFTRDLQ